MNLIAKLSLDGSGFQAGLARATAHADAAGARMARSIGNQFKKLALGFIGIGALGKFISETKRWASDVNAVRDEYANLGVQIDDITANSMVEMGRQMAEIEVIGKRMFLSLIEGAIGFNREIRERVIESQADVLRKWGVPERVVKRAVAAANYGDRITSGLLQGPPLPEVKTKNAKSFSVTGIETDQLGRIGGSVGLPNDRTLGVLREQLSQLRKIESNTKQADSYVP